MRYHSHTEKGSYRGWITVDRSIDLFQFQIATRTKLCVASLNVDDEYLSATWSVPRLYLNAAVRKPKFITAYDREIGVHIHSWAISWNIWHSTMEWDSSTPKWRNGSFRILDLVFGRQIYSEKEIETRDIDIPMPEGTYAATAKLYQATWKRTRSLCTKTIKTINIVIPGGGIPHEGKAKSGHDCGGDATHGLTTSAYSIAEGVGILVGNVLEQRVKYGGWKDWNWKREDQPK